MVSNVPSVYYEKNHFSFFKDLKGNLNLILYVVFLKTFLLTFSIQITQRTWKWLHCIYQIQMGTFYVINEEEDI